jgi:transcriptional regulator with XRE-family HTH domain
MQAIKTVSKNILSYSRIKFIFMHISKIAYSVETTTQNIDLHYGHIVERIVRRNQMGISEIARKLNVSRRTLYNWFEMKKLDLEVICKIGDVIGHDFSPEFPEEFTNRNMSISDEKYTDIQSAEDQANDAIYYWMDKYIKLLEKFNAVLSSDTTASLS